VKRRAGPRTRAFFTVLMIISVSAFPKRRRSIPFSKTDWAETGVEPDVKVKAADALETAKKLAESKLQRK